MFDQTKVNHKSFINPVKIPEREIREESSQKTSNEFFSMIMNTLEISDRNSRVDNNQKSGEQKNEVEVELSNNEQINSSQKNSGIYDTLTRKENSSNGNNDKVKENSSDGYNDNVKESRVSENKIEISKDVSPKDIKDKSQISLKDIKDKEGKIKNHDEEKTILNQFNINIKNIMEILRSAFNGNKKAEEENFQKLFSNFKHKTDKDNSYKGMKKIDAGNNHKTSNEFSELQSKNFKEIITRELFKAIESKKSGGKQIKLTDSELKELAVNIINNLKKSRVNEVVKHEIRIQMMIIKMKKNLLFPLISSC